MDSPNPTPQAVLPAPPPNRSHPLLPHGRFGRLSFIAWNTLFFLAYQLAKALLLGINALLPRLAGEGAPPIPKPASVADALSLPNAVVFLIAVVFLVLTVIFAVRRCHDLNRSGWYLLLYLIPFVNLVFLFYLHLKRGDPADNRYGPPRPTATWEVLLGVAGAVLIVAISALTLLVLTGAPHGVLAPVAV